MVKSPKSIFFTGVALLSLSFVLAKLFFFALPWAAQMGKVGRGVFRECVIAINIALGYWLMPSPALKRQFLRLGMVLELCFLGFVSIYSLMEQPHEMVMQFQVLFRELLLSPVYFVLFYFAMVHPNQGLDASRL